MTTANTHTATIDWGDGTAARDGCGDRATVRQHRGRHGSLAKDHVFADEGPYTVTVTVKDQDGGTGMQIFNLTINDVPPTIDKIADQPSVKEGDTVHVDAVAFHDQGTEDKHVATIDWGDNSTPDDGTVTEHTGPTGTTVPNDGSIKIPDHVYADEGTYTVTVTLKDADGEESPVTQTFTVTVEAVPITIDPLDNQSVSEGDSLQLNGPDDIVNFHAQGTLDRHIAGIDWATAPSAGRPWCKFPSTAARPAPPFPTTARYSCPTISMPTRHLHRRGQHYRP